MANLCIHTHRLIYFAIYFLETLDLGIYVYIHRLQSMYIKPKPFQYFMQNKTPKTPSFFPTLFVKV